jgi:hypothetical protein
MLTFNQLLVSVDLPLDRTRFVRHKDDRPTAKTQPYWLWQRQDGSLEEYQRIQVKDVFEPGQYLASFVVSPKDENIFVGVYHVLERSKVEDPKRTCPVSGASVLGNFLYRIERLDLLKEYEGRVLIDWGKGYRKWVQHADKQVKSLVELRPERHEVPFPGVSQFMWSIQQLENIPKGWREHLSQAFGVYLLISRKPGHEGKLYIGSAQGDEGFLQRWRSYHKNGHGNNKDLKTVADGDYQVCILEAASSNASQQDVYAMESLWKEKLLSRMYGLNSN